MAQLGDFMVFLTTKDLLKMRRDIPVPFSMRIKKGITEETLEIKKVLRVVPGKRLTALCLWREKDVVVKIFFHPMRWAKNQSRDLFGTSLLLERGLATPLILNDTVTADRKAALIIMEYLKDGNTLNHINRETAPLKASQGSVAHLMRLGKDFTPASDCMSSFSRVAIEKPGCKSDSISESAKSIPPSMSD